MAWGGTDTREPRRSRIVRQRTVPGAAGTPPAAATAEAWTAHRGWGCGINAHLMPQEPIGAITRWVTAWKQHTTTVLATAPEPHGRGSFIDP